MVRAGLRRLLVIVVVVLGATAALSAALGALAGDVRHALAVGYYLVGAAVLLGSLALGIRGPMRVDREIDETERPAFAFGPIPLPSRRRTLRKATDEERREARLGSLGLFVFGVALVLLGAVVDPSRHVF